MTAGVANTSANAIAAHIGPATGALGFLKWVESVFPAPIAAQVLRAAAYKSGTLGRLGALGWLGTIRRPQGPLIRPPRKRFPVGIAGLGFLGDDTTSTDSNAALATDWNIVANAQGADTSGVTATPTADSTGVTSAPASQSWISNIGSILTNAVSAAGQAYLTVNQTQAANQILQTNLQRAQMGLSPLPYTPQQLGLTGPTLNFGLSQSTGQTVMLLGGGLLLVMLLGSAMKSKSKR